MNFRENFLTKTGRGGHWRTGKDAHARAGKSSNHHLKMMASFTFNNRMVVLDCLQFSNQLDRSDVNKVSNVSKTAGN